MFRRICYFHFHVGIIFGAIISYFISKELLHNRKKLQIIELIESSNYDHNRINEQKTLLSSSNSSSPANENWVSKIVQFRNPFHLKSLHNRSNTGNSNNSNLENNNNNEYEIIKDENI